MSDRRDILLLKEERRDVRPGFLSLRAVGIAKAILCV